jgi:hypothetical protein
VLPSNDSNDPGDDGYDEARKLYNGMIDKRPRLIARCADVADVITAVNFGRAQDPTARFTASAQVIWPGAAETRDGRW